MLIEDAVLKPAVFLLLPHCAYPTELGIRSLGKHSVSASFCKAQGTQLYEDRAASKKKKSLKKTNPPSHSVVTGYVIRWEGECRESGHVCVCGGYF